LNEIKAAPLLNGIIMTLNTVMVLYVWNGNPGTSSYRHAKHSLSLVVQDIGLEQHFKTLEHRVSQL
jgi:hypothetical protein